MNAIKQELENVCTANGLRLRCQWVTRWPRPQDASRRYEVEILHAAEPIFMARSRKPERALSAAIDYAKSENAGWLA